MPRNMRSIWNLLLPFALASAAVTGDPLDRPRTVKSAGEVKHDPDKIDKARAKRERRNAKRLKESQKW